MIFVAIKGDGDIYGLPCATQIYGETVIEEVVNDIAEHKDEEGNELYPITDASERCGGCLQPVCRCTGSK